MAAETAIKQLNQKRAKVPQSDFPNVTLENALRLPQTLWDNFAGKGAAPMNVAIAIDKKPTSGGWRNLCGASIAYGLSEGGYNANEIALTSLGLRIVRPTIEGDNRSGIREALMKPRIQREFFEKYDNAKFPKDVIAQNVLIDMGLPKDRGAQALDILMKNARFAGVLHEVKGDLYVSFRRDEAQPLNKAGNSGAADVSLDDNARLAVNDEPNGIPPEKTPEASPLPGTPATPDVQHVFITHGKNAKILEQIEKIVKYGSFYPVIAKNHETSAKPVPDKVLSDMRACQAAVIHVGSEGILRDEAGNIHSKINGNVLIEIGIARALYGNNFILLVEDGLQLPSNLQGLYECRYQGDELNMEATMKILEAFSDFKKTGPERG